MKTISILLGTALIILLIFAAIILLSRVPSGYPEYKDLRILVTEKYGDDYKIVIHPPTFPTETFILAENDLIFHSGGEISGTLSIRDGNFAYTFNFSDKISPDYAVDPENETIITAAKARDTKGWCKIMLKKKI